MVTIVEALATMGEGDCIVREKHRELNAGVYVGVDGNLYDTRNAEPYLFSGEDLLAQDWQVIPWE